MDLPFEVARAVSALAFLGYGLACVATDHMVAEFERFGLSGFRLMVGWLEVLGAAGLIAGVWVPEALVVGAGGLTALMVLGVGTRLRVGDSVLQTAPAMVLLLLNGYILQRSIHLL